MTVENAPICKVEGCEREEIHRVHAVRAWCFLSDCESFRKRRPEGVSVMPLANGMLVCASCQCTMELAIEDQSSPWRDVVKKCYTRLRLLRGLDPETKLLCPRAGVVGFDCSQGCRCDGTSNTTAGVLVQHYENVLDEFETDEVKHPLVATIEKVVSVLEPKRFLDLYRDVEADYGSIGPNEKTGQRVLHRHLKRVVERGKVIRVSLGDRLYAYLARGSKLATDVEYCREVVRDAYMSATG